MKLIIEKEKIANYLLKPLEKADKSIFLKLIGYSLDNWENLRDDILIQFSEYVYEIYEQNDFGILYKIEGKLVAPKKTVDLITIWIKLKNEETLKFVTLFPNHNYK
jgi:hypothetical protein